MLHSSRLGSDSHTIAEIMPTTFEWDRIMGIDPVSIRKWRKDQLDEIFNVFALVTVHSSHQYEHTSASLSTQMPSG